MVLFNELIDDFLVMIVQLCLWTILILSKQLTNNFGSLIALFEYLELSEFDSSEDGEY